VNASLYTRLARALGEQRTVVLVTALDGPRAGLQLLVEPGRGTSGDLGSPSLNADACVRAAAFVPGFRCGQVTLDDGHDARRFFVEVHGPGPQLVIVGAVHVAVPLVHLARVMGFRTVVVDPRQVFASPERFAHADALLAEWPQDAFERIAFHDNTHLVVLSHDLKIDVPALAFGLRRDLPYLGALGSRKTGAKRARALLDEGFADADLARIHAPIGLDLGGRRAEDVALAIMAEIVAVANAGGAARPQATAGGASTPA
jgi:xanthine dehydrogenase accessory factor